MNVLLCNGSRIESGLNVGVVRARAQGVRSSRGSDIFGLSLEHRRREVQERSYVGEVRYQITGVFLKIKVGGDGEGRVTPSVERRCRIAWSQTGCM